MPILSFPIQNTKKAIQEPVCYSVAEDLLKFIELKVPRKITLVEAGDTVNTHGAAFNVDMLNIPLLDTEDRLQIEYEYDTTLEDLTTVVAHRVEQPHIFYDPALNVFVKNIYIPEKIKLKFKYISQSKQAATNFYNEFMVRLAQLRGQYEHTVSLHYPIESNVFDIIRTIHSLREHKHGYGDSIGDYLSKCLTVKADIAFDSVGKDATLVIPERRARVLGLFNSRLFDKPEKNDSVYITDFTYEFTYDKPVMQVIDYPIMVHNQLMPPKYTQYVLDLEEPEFKEYRRTLSQLGFETFEQTNHIHRFLHKVGHFNVPVFDQFIPTNNAPGTVTVATVLCSIEDDGRTLLNLNELGDIAINQDLLDFMSDTEYRYMTTPYKSIFNLELYREKYVSSGGTLVCTPNLDVLGAKPLDPRRVNRVRFSICIDLSLLDRAAIERLAANRPAAKIITDNLCDLFLRGGNIGNAGRCGWLHELLDLPTWWYLYTGNKLNPRQPPLHKDVEKFFRDNGLFGPGNDFRNRLEEYKKYSIHQRTVMLSGIIALRKEG
jgi:hypothetical protein